MNEAATIKLINEKLINDVVKLIGKEESIKRYNRLKTTNPEEYSYSYTSKRLGRDVLDYINSL